MVGKCNGRVTRVENEEVKAKNKENRSVKVLRRQYRQWMSKMLTQYRQHTTAFCLLPLMRVYIPNYAELSTTDTSSSELPLNQSFDKKFEQSISMIWGTKIFDDQLPLGC
jgi:hypothetical protein